MLEPNQTMRDKIKNNTIGRKYKINANKGYALIATISVMSLLLIMTMAFLKLSSVESRKAINHFEIAQTNARFALQMAISQLQMYAGSDQRVTARADITDTSWGNENSSLANPQYTYIWDVKGSEIDLSLSSPQERVALIGSTESHRPGMKPGHDFSIKPAVLVSGNEAYDLLDANGDMTQTSYPSGYVTADPGSTSGREMITIISDNQILPSEVEVGANTDGSDRVVRTENEITVPLVNITGDDSNNGSYAWWVGDDSIKARMNIGNQHDLNTAAARTLAHRSPLNMFRSSLDTTLLTPNETDKIISLETYNTINNGLSLGWNYSPDITSSSISLLTDTRSAGLKQDFTYILNNPDNSAGITDELKDNSYMFDSIIGNSILRNSPTFPWADQSGRDAARIPGISYVGGTQHGGLAPKMSHLRTYAQNVASNDSTPISIGGENEVFPVIGQAQLGVYALLVKPEGGTPGDFKVYYGVFPSVTLWNPYNVPIKMDQDVSVTLERRSASYVTNYRYFKGNYTIKGGGNSLTVGTREIFADDRTGRDPFGVVFQESSGWRPRMNIAADPNLVIPPGKSVIFSMGSSSINKTDGKTTIIADPKDRSVIFGPGPDGTLVRLSPGSRNKVTLDIPVQPGWNPGTGHYFALDDRTYNVRDFAAGPIPNLIELEFGLGTVNTSTTTIINNNLIWSASINEDQPNKKAFSIWSRLTSDSSATTPSYTPPSPAGATNNILSEQNLLDSTNMDANETFPGYLIKHALRMNGTSLAKSFDETYDHDSDINTPEIRRSWRESFVHDKQLSNPVIFPFVAQYNPAASYHAPIGKTLNPGNRSAPNTDFYSSAATADSPTLMGGIFDHASSQFLYSTNDGADPNDSFTTIDGHASSNREKMVIYEVANGNVFSGYPNGESASITSFTQLNNARLLRGVARNEYHWYSTSNYPTYPIGNSLGDFRLNLEEQTINHSGLYYTGSVARLDWQNYRATSTHMDASYLLNDRFYDHYFFSTVPQSGSFDSNSPLINSRLKTTNNDINELRNINSAKHFTMQGGFNINSTSVKAWEMLLTSSLGVNYPGVTASNDVNISSRLTTVGASKARDTTVLDAGEGTKAIQLSQEEIKKLAKAIVQQVKRRGPFPSLSAFVNRTNYLSDLLRPNANSSSAGISSTPLVAGNVDVRYSGAIQAAIDYLDYSSDANKLNKKIVDDSTIDPNEFVNDTRIYPAHKAVRKSANSHLPSSLKQSDIIKQIEPVMTARGDTFTVRAVGISKDSGGRIIAKVACEAVVQRTLDYMDSSQSSDIEPYSVSRSNPGAENETRTFTSNLNAVNKRYGRRFQIVLFKWLPIQEVNGMEIR